MLIILVALLTCWVRKFLPSLRMVYIFDTIIFFIAMRSCSDLSFVPCNKSSMTMCDDDDDDDEEEYFGALQRWLDLRQKNPYMKSQCARAENSRFTSGKWRHIGESWRHQHNTNGIVNISVIAITSRLWNMCCTICDSVVNWGHDSRLNNFKRFNVNLMVTANIYYPFFYIARRRCITTNWRRATWGCHFS